MAFVFPSAEAQLQQEIEQQRREKDKTLSPISSENAPSSNPLIDEYATAQKRQHSASETFFSALISAGEQKVLTMQNNSENTVIHDENDQKYKQLTMLDQVMIDVLKPSRGKPHHLKKLMKALAVHEFEREAKRKKKLLDLSEKDQKQNIAQREIEIARSLLAVLVHSMVNEVVSQIGTNFNSSTQLSAQKILNSIIPSVKIEILVRFGYAGTSQKTARQNSQRLSSHLKKDVPDLDNFFAQFGFSEQDFNITLKSMIEAIAELSGLFEGIDHHNYQPSSALMQLLNDPNLTVSLNHIHPAMPMIVPPFDWSSTQKGGRYYNPRSIEKLIGLNNFLHHWKRMMKDLEMPIVYRAINALQQTSWCINLPVLNIIKSVYNQQASQLPKRLQDIHDQAYGSHLKRANKSHIMMKRRLGMDETNRFPYQALLEDLEKQPAFWYPWSMDARGRLYPQAPWLNIQGDDFSRGILQFADQKAVTSNEARAYLAVHGTQFVQKDIMKKDLSLDDSLNLTADERYQWIQLHQDDIIASANDPLGYAWWTEVADAELWQFLSFCMAWRDMLEGKSIALPVMMDGSCNGLQHMAALTRSPLIAKQTNLTNNARPEDIYTYIKAAVNAYLVSPNHPDHSNSRTFIKDWIMAQPNFMSRNVAKQVVIGFSYGSRKYKDKILQALVKLDIFKALSGGTSNTQATMPSIDPALIELAQALFAWEEGDKHRIKGSLKIKEPKECHQVDNATHQITEDAENDSLLSASDEDALDLAEEEIADARQETVNIPSYKFNCPPNLDNAMNWLNQSIQGIVNEDVKLVARHRQVLSAWLMDRIASYLAEQFEVVMNHELKHAVTLMDWLGQCTDQFKPLPSCWLSPAGFPVLQPKFDKDKSAKAIESELFGVIYRALPPETAPKTASTSVTRIRSNALLETVNSRGQKTAIPPNFIHSLDASHLMMTVNAALDEGIDQFAMVHDSFGTHAEDAPKLARILREAFIELHATPQLAVLEDWIASVQKLHADDLQPLETLSNNVAQQEMLKQLKQSLNISVEGVEANNVKVKENKNRKAPPRLPDIPFAEDQGNFDLTEVKNARYFFA